MFAFDHIHPAIEAIAQMPFVPLHQFGFKIMQRISGGNALLAIGANALQDCQLVLQQTMQPMAFERLDARG
jgi:hypothetical protein